MPLSSIGGAGGSVIVAESGNNYNGNSYTITFGGTLTATAIPLVSTDAFTPVNSVVTIPAVTTGSFSLSFNGQLASFSTPVTALQIQNALNALTSISGAGGTVTVAPNGNNFTITFGGTLANTAIPIVFFTDTFPLVSNAANTQIGTSTPTSVLSPVNDPIVATDAVWRGPVTLDTNTTVSAQTSTTLPGLESASRLVFTGSIGDLYNGTSTSPLPSNLTITGGGEVDLDAANTYDGTTYVQQGVVSIGNQLALGGTGTGTQANPSAFSEIQQLTLTNATANSTAFDLTFNGYVGTTSPNLTTSPITFTGNPQTDAQNVMLALDALILSNGPESDSTGAVTVKETIVSGTATITITFGGTLSGFPLNLLGAQITSPPAAAAVQVSRVQAGTGGTVVENGASMEVAGSFAVAGEPLILQGNGTTQDIQTLSLVGTTTGTFTLNFLGADASGTMMMDTTSVSLNVTSTSSTLASNIQSALDNLSNIGGVGGSVTVTATGTPGVYQVAFGGTLSGDDVSTLSANVGGLATGNVVPATTQPGSQTIAGVPTQWFSVGPADRRGDASERHVHPDQFQPAGHRTD